METRTEVLGTRVAHAVFPKVVMFPEEEGETARKKHAPMLLWILKHG